MDERDLADGLKRRTSPLRLRATSLQTIDHRNLYRHQLYLINGTGLVLSSQPSNAL